MKKIILIIATGLFILPSYAQLLQNRYEFSIWGAGGTSSLHYEPTLGDRKAGTGGLLGIGCSYFLDYHWSIGTGLEFSMLKESLSFPLISDNYITPYQSNQHLMWVRVDGQNYKQTQETYYVNIPLIIKGQFPIKQGHNIYFSVGPKFGIPVSSTYSAEGTFTTTGVDVNDNKEPLSSDWYNMTKYGFFSDSLVSSGNRSMSLTKNLILSFEAGIKWRISPKYSLYSGIFFDYGLNDIRQGDTDNQFFAYNRSQPDNYELNNVLLSRYTASPESFARFPENPALPFVDKVSTMAVGIKLQLSWGSGLFEKKHEVHEVYVNTNPVVDKPVEKITVPQKEEIVKKDSNKPVKSLKEEYAEFQKKTYDKPVEAKKDEKPVESTPEEKPDFEGSISGFAASSDKITPEMLPFLDKKVYWLKKYPDVKLTLVGHADDNGSDNFNYLLGNDRANVVKAYLVSQGISEKRLTTTTEGKTHPLIPKAGEAERASNRRVEFILQRL
ncbi:MAG: OmpA family protein [Dysgonamonadaceae bacterium]|jgi:outer membrane protein OmpA-like peptidoglycan-associated protein|nr:OmpA family protein [Dysgonamonadaceae bacterium]